MKGAPPGLPARRAFFANAIALPHNPSIFECGIPNMPRVAIRVVDKC